jgi:hypothetical protein
LRAIWFSLIKLDRLRQDLGLGDGALESVLGAISAVASATDQPGRLAAKQAFVDTLATWLGWKPADLATLIGKPTDLTDLGLLGAQLPADYGVDLLARLGRAIAAVKRLGVTAAQASPWCEPTVSDAAAKEIRNSAKSKSDSGAWQTVAVPLQDSLRDKQREALVSYLAAHPAKWTTSLDKATADDLYAHFLIDVQMSPCQQTSRIAQAIGSVQLFAQRCLMGLEAGIQTSDPKWRQWNDWMKSFRVWEANRKIWLYPENWIEPELRDDKSPFFKDLENELLQSNLDNAAAEQALMNYLEKLDQVARQEIAGTYEDEDKTQHVFGRTFNTPHVYFYRRREGATLSWTPWEKLELDIEGDHLIPVVWNRKLMLIWPIFTQKQDEQPVTMPPVGGTLRPGNRYWEIQLAWSEYQYGHWTGKSLSTPVRFDAHLGRPAVVFGDYVPWLHVGLNGGLIFQQIGPGGGGGGGSAGGDGGGGNGGGGGGGGGLGGSGNGSSTSTGTVPPLVPQDLVTFKAFVSEDVLTVRGYRLPLRRIPVLRLPKHRQHRRPMANPASDLCARTQKHGIRCHVVCGDRVRSDDARWHLHVAAEHRAADQGSASRGCFRGHCRRHQHPGSRGGAISLPPPGSAPGSPVHRGFNRPFRFCREARQLGARRDCNRGHATSGSAGKRRHDIRPGRRDQRPHGTRCGPWRRSDRARAHFDKSEPIIEHAKSLFQLLVGPCV